MSPLRLSTSLYFVFSLILALACAYLHYSVYPRLRSASESAFADVHKKIMSLSYMTFLPLMILELACFALIIHFEPDYEYGDWAFFGLFKVGLWVITVPVMMEIHKKLKQKKDDKLIAELTNLNLIRLLMWGLMSAIILHGMVKYWQK